MSTAEYCTACRRSYPAGAHQHGTRWHNSDVVARWRHLHHTTDDATIAEQLGMSLSNLRRHLNTAGIYIHGPRGPYKPRKRSKLPRYPPLCDVKLMEQGKFPAQCHRDLGHDGLHRAFVVGGTGPGYWRDGDTVTHRGRNEETENDDQRD